MKPIVNKDNDLISRYLSIRQELIEEFKKSNDKNKFNDYWLSSFVENKGDVDSLLYEYDKSITKSKLSEKSYIIIDDGNVVIVEHDFIAYEHRHGVESFKTKEERKDWLSKKSKEYDYNAFKVFDCLELKELKGTIDDNYENFIEKYENGYTIFIKSDSLFSDNLIGNFIEE